MLAIIRRSWQWRPGAPAVAIACAVTPATEVTVQLKQMLSRRDKPEASDNMSKDLLETDD